MTSPAADSTSDAVPGKGRSLRFWLILSMAVAGVYALLALRLAFRSEYLVQDDARQHVFWMRRFLDPGLFPNDLIADYFQSVAPLGYKSLYWVLAKAGLDPLLASKLLPAALGLICAYLAFRVFMEILPDPRGGFVASVLLSQALWMKDDLMSATPRAFVYPLFLGFLLCFLRRKAVGSAMMVVLIGLFYPQAVFVAAGLLVLSLIRWEGGRPRLSRERSDYLLSGAGLAAAAAVLLPFVLSASHYGPVITAAQARERPEFWEMGRSQFFMKSWRFWHNMDRSGLLPRAVQSPFMWVAPFLLFMLRRESRLLELARPRLGVLARLVIGATGMWAAAHLLLFKLHLPSRYTHWSFRIVLALAAGVVLLVWWDALQARVARLREEGKLGAARWTGVAAALLFGVMLAYPHFSHQFPDNSYKPGPAKRLYAFLRQQPKDVVVASMSGETDLLPTFARRSILVGREYAIPYHLGYANPLRERGQELMRAQYTEDPAELLAFMEKYGVDLWLVDRKAFNPTYPKRRSWFTQIEPRVREISQRLEEGHHPVLEGLMERCQVFENKELVLLSADRIREALAEAPPVGRAGSEDSQLQLGGT